MRRLTPDEIKEIREGLGMTRAEFAAELGNCENSVWGWEAGRRQPRRVTRRHMLMLWYGAERRSRNPGPVQPPLPFTTRLRA
jgi:transcriptional regulator with XRE-family HTH domain